MKYKRKEELAKEKRMEEEDDMRSKKLMWEKEKKGGGGGGVWDYDEGIDLDSGSEDSIVAFLFTGASLA